jgi:hypothetical protein
MAKYLQLPYNVDCGRGLPVCVAPTAVKNTSFRFPVIKDCSALAARRNVYLNWPLIHRRRFARDAPGVVLDGGC